MEITRKVFWNQALIGGTIIGLALTGISLAQWALGAENAGIMSKLLRWLYWIVFVLLTFGFTRKISRMSRPEEGFPYSRCFGFVLAMMLFAGFIFGFYQAIMYIWVDPESRTALIDGIMVIFQDSIGGGQFDQMYDMYYRILGNPLFWIFSGMLNNIIYGGVIGLFTSAIAQRKPNPFAAANTDTSANGDGE